MEKVSFDENTTNIEDRLCWGYQKRLSHLLYTSCQCLSLSWNKSRGKVDRAEKIVSIIENLEGSPISLSKLIVKKLNNWHNPIKGSPTTFEIKTC